MADLQTEFMVVIVEKHLEMHTGNESIILYDIESSAANDTYFRNKHSSRTRRSYRDFETLRRLLVSRHGDVQVPDIPPFVAPKDESKDDTIKTRKKGFQKFLEQALAIIELKSDPCLQLFIQSPQSMDRIVEQIESNAQQEDPNSNRQNEERTIQDSPEGEDPIAGDPDGDEHMDNRSDDGLIFQMDDV